MKTENKFKITQSTFEEIIATIGSSSTETGGLLFGSRKDYLVTRFLFDKNAKTTSSSYTFNTAYLNPIIKKWWDEEKLELLGFIHSHPSSFGRLSAPDKRYFDEQFNNIPVDFFLTPLVFSAKDAPFKFIPLAYHKNGKTEELKLEILPDNFREIPAKKEVQIEESKTEFISDDKKVVVNINNTTTSSKKDKQTQTPTIVVVKNEPENKLDSEMITEKLQKILDVIPKENNEEIEVKTEVTSKIYHYLLIGFIFFAFLIMLSLTPNIYKYFVELLN